MICIVPIMGHGTVGKDYVVDKIIHRLKNAGVCAEIMYFDTSKSAKEIIDGFATPNGYQHENEKLYSELNCKGDSYRNALVSIINGLDMLDIRLYETMHNIESYISILRNRDQRADIIFFLNIRDTVFVKKLKDIYEPRGYAFRCLIVVDGEGRTPEYKDTPLDNKEYEQGLTTALKADDIAYYQYVNDDVSSERFDNDAKQIREFYRLLTKKDFKEE